MAEIKSTYKQRVKADRWFKAIAFALTILLTIIFSL